MHLRRTTALTAASLLLAVPMLSSCGFNYATDRPYTPAAGTNNRDGSVDVLGAVIVSAQDDSGTFIASLSNNDQQKSVDFESISGAGDSSLKFQDFPPRTIDPGAALNLSQDGGVPVTGTFTAGDVVAVSISLSNGERVNMDVPVVADDGYFAGFDTSGSSSSSAQPSGSSSPSSSPSSSASPSSSPSSSASPSSSPSE